MTGINSERCSRNVGNIVLVGAVDIPALPPRLATDCERELTERIQLTPGDVEALSLPRARTRWPSYRSYVQSAGAWLEALGLPDILTNSEIALMACRGARYHHDAEHYGGAAFCNLFLSEDKGLDLIFPFAKQRIALQRGTVVLFDTAQPHAVIDRERTTFHADHFAPERDCSLLFLTWELPLTNKRISDVLGVQFNALSTNGLQVAGHTLEMHGKPVALCPESGQWQAP